MKHEEHQKGLKPICPIGLFVDWYRPFRGKDAKNDSTHTHIRTPFLTIIFRCLSVLLVLDQDKWERKRGGQKAVKRYVVFHVAFLCQSSWLSFFISFACTVDDKENI
jgi:hypothetical protein